MFSHKNASFSSKASMSFCLFNLATSIGVFPSEFSAVLRWQKQIRKDKNFRVRYGGGTRIYGHIKEIHHVHVYFLCTQF